MLLNVGLYIQTFITRTLYYVLYWNYVFYFLNGGSVSFCLIQIIKLLDKEGVEWSEENRGTVLIKLAGCREFSFLDTDSDSDSN